MVPDHGGGRVNKEEFIKLCETSPDTINKMMAELEGRCWYEWGENTYVKDIIACPHCQLSFSINKRKIRNPDYLHSIDAIKRVEAKLGIACMDIWYRKAGWLTDHPAFFRGAYFPTEHQARIWGCLAKGEE